MGTHNFSIGDLIVRNDNGNGPLLFKPMANCEDAYTDYRKLMTKSVFLVLGEEFETSWVYSDFGDRSVAFLTKVFWLEENDIVYIENWSLCHCFDKLA